MIERHLKSLALRVARWLAAAEGQWVGAEPVFAQRIYCANHSSHLDALLLMAALPAQLRENLRPVAAADYWSKGRLRRYLTEHVFRTVMMERDSNTLNPLGSVFQALRRGDSLIFFPEGTRGTGTHLEPLKPGIYWLARAFPHVQIVPVWIENAARVFPKRAVLPWPGHCRLRFGAPIEWEPQEDADAFLSRLRHAMEALRLP